MQFLHSASGLKFIMLACCTQGTQTILKYLQALLLPAQLLRQFARALTIGLGPLSCGSFFRRSGRAGSWSLRLGGILKHLYGVLGAHLGTLEIPCALHAKTLIILRKYKHFFVKPLILHMFYELGRFTANVKIRSGSSRGPLSN